MCPNQDALLNEDPHVHKALSHQNERAPIHLWESVRGPNQEGLQFPFYVAHQPDI